MKAKWYWFLSQERDLLCDLDSEYELERAQEHLGLAVRGGYLKVEKVYKQPSETKGAYHLAVILAAPMHPIDRALWEGYLGDVWRGLFNVARLRQEHGISSLLIRRDCKLIPGRKPDYACDCKGKHGDPGFPRSRCLIMQKLKQEVCTFFPQEPERKRSLWPDGKVPMRLIRKGVRKQ